MPIVEIERVKQIFRFLKAFAERRVIPPQRLDQQPWQLLLRELPAHESITVSRFELGVSGTGGGDGSLMSVRRPNLSKCPRPPALVEPFLKAGWEDPFKPVEVRESVTREHQGELITELFAADLARVQLLSDWNALREAWTVRERPTREAMRVFERMYELQARMNREGDRLELLIADGRLRWKSPVGLIDHPLLLKRVELVFDAQSDPPVIRIEDADRAAEVYTGLLASIDGITSQQLQQLRSELDAGGYHPLDGLATTAFLRALTARTGARARFEPEFIRGEATEAPLVMRDAVLMLRQRVAGFADACDLVLQDLEHQQSVPWALSRLVGVEPPDDASADPYVEYSPWGEPSDVLLSKVANAEQVQIARALDRHRAVLVQGPPGTGKSHTIANLVGHFVAQGKRVLVTSHATKALRVLRNQIVESLRPLCVAVLEQDLESRAQLEDAVRGILARITVSSEPQLHREANELAVQREALIAEIGRLTRDIQTARATEYEPILIAGEAIAPAEAARLVRANEHGNDWIPGPVSASAPLPLTGEELARLYKLMTSLTATDEHEVDASAPDIAALPTPERFAALVAALTSSEPETNAQFWDQTGLADPKEPVRQLAILAKDICTQIGAMTPWQKSLVAAGYAGEADATLWTSLATVIQQAPRVNNP
jgi:hypothetical protein